MLYQIKSYFKFLLKSGNQHGVHSPFVYDLITKCFYDKTIFAEYSILKAFRKKLSTDSTIIEITDFGEGSRIFNSNQRKISSIAKHAGITEKRQKLLFRLVRFFNFDSMLELGTSLGLATTAMTLGNPAASLSSVEGCPNTAGKANYYFDHFNLKNIQVSISSFDKFLMNKNSEKWQLVYIDGNHNKEKTLTYFEILLKQKTNDSIFIFDDIYWSREMTEAWQAISTHRDVTVSIDTFYWGLVFFRKEQPKEHFSVRL